MISLEGKLFIKLDGHWFDLTNYTKHPGGRSILQTYHLKDATEAFNAIRGHCEEVVNDFLRENVVTNPLLVVYLNLIA